MDKNNQGSVPKDQAGVDSA